MPIPYEQYTVHTADGFALALYRSRPKVRAIAGARRQPVLLIPGFSSNRFTFGVRRDQSLAGALNATHRDVWIAELRGARSSRYLGGKRPRIDVDAKLFVDLPAVLDFIQQATGEPQVDIIGHSLGGLLALLAAGGPDGARIANIVTLATPGTFKGIVGAFEASGPLFRGLARGVEQVVERLGDFPLTPLARTRGPLPHFFAFQRHFLPGACDAVVRRLYLDHAIEAVHGAELAQLTRWVREGIISDRNGVSLEPRFAAVRAPALIVAASRDRVSPEIQAHAAYAKIRSPDKQFRVIGRAYGARRDYAHADLLLAETARIDVFEPIIDWLEQRAQRAEAVASAPALTSRPEAAAR